MFKFMVTCVVFTYYIIFKYLYSHLGAIRISAFDVTFKYNDKCESQIAMLKKWALCGEISSSELQVKAILEPY